jgi:Domain of unknown function (DUF4956)
MLEWFADSQTGAGSNSVTVMFVRLVAACLFGFLVAASYRLHRYPAPVPATFPLTLVLLSILIAMVMQVIDDRVARAFSLVGALSIVRFRTVLDDTQDIAFVIFAVVAGMASGTGAIGVAAIGSVVMIGTLWVSRWPVFASSKCQLEVGATPDADLTLRTSVGTNCEKQIKPLLDANLISYRLLSAETARGGSMLEWRYAVQFKVDIAPADLIERCCKTDGIQNVEMKMRDASN